MWRTAIVRLGNGGSLPGSVKLSLLSFFLHTTRENPTSDTSQRIRFHNFVFKIKHGALRSAVTMKKRASHAVGPLLLTILAYTARSASYHLIGAPRGLHLLFLANLLFLESL